MPSDSHFGAQADAEFFSHRIAQLPQVGPGKLPIGRIGPKHEGWRSRLGGVFGTGKSAGWKPTCCTISVEPSSCFDLFCASLRAVPNGSCANSTCFANLYPARMPDPSLSDILHIAPGR